MVEPGGVVGSTTCTQKEVLNAELGKPHDPKTINHAKDAADARSIHLLSDPDYLFVAVNGKLDNNVVGPGDVAPNFRAGQGLRSVPVNGLVYCYDRASGKRGDSTRCSTSTW